MSLTNSNYAIMAKSVKKMIEEANAIKLGNVEKIKGALRVETKVYPRSNKAEKITMTSYGGDKAMVIKATQFDGPPTFYSPIVRFDSARTPLGSLAFSNKHRKQTI